MAGQPKTRARTRAAIEDPELREMVNRRGAEVYSELTSKAATLDEVILVLSRVMRAAERTGDLSTARSAADSLSRILAGGAAKPRRSGPWWGPKAEK